VLVPAIGFLTVIGSYAVHNNVDDVIIMVVLGIIGWVLNRFGYRPSPIVLGIILGPIAEAGFVQGHLIGTARGNVLAEFFGRPISVGIIVFIVISLMYPILTQRWQKHRSGGAR
jgi:putative tricarboxylic transport membrane protein